MLSSPEPTAPPASEVATWVGFSMMCVGMFMAILDVQVVATSLPAIQSALAIPTDQMSWIQTAYLIAEVIAIPLTGFVTRVLTMRGLFVVSISVFTLASVGCAASGTFPSLISWRILQGFAGGMIIPAVFSAVFLMFPVARQGIATTLAGVLAVLAPTVGPVVGGWITDTLSWHWLFLINLAPGVISAALAGVMLPRPRMNLALARTLDVASLALIAIALAALQIALKEAPARGWTSAYVSGLLIASTLSAVAFIWRSLRVKAPFVELRTFANRNFTLGCILSFILGVGLFGSVYLMPVFLGFVRHHTAFEIGAIMLVTGLAQLVTAPIAAALERRADGRMLTVAGFSLLAVGLWMSADQTPRTDFSEMIWPQIARGVAFMFCLLPPTRLALAHLPPAQVADGSGLFNLMRNLGGAIGIALVDTIIFGRTKMHADALLAKLMQGDASTASFIGIPPGLLSSRGPDVLDPQTMAMLRPALESAAMTTAVNEAWMMIAALTAAAAICALFVRRVEQDASLAAGSLVKN
jgi:DHA2 family multidrug resistance protein